MNPLGIIAGIGLLLMACLGALLYLAAPVHAEAGIASWYGHPYHGRRTASGIRYNMHADTCAHLSLPFGTLIRVTNQRNGRSTICRVTDRGPFVRGRIVDVSLAGARALRLNGIARVSLHVISSPRGRCATQRGNRWRTCRSLGRGF